MIEEVTVGGKIYTTGQKTALGTIKEFFWGGEYIWFSTEEGNQFKTNLLLDTR